MGQLTFITPAIATPCVNFTVMLLSLPRRWSLFRTLLYFAALLLFIRFPVSMFFARLGAYGTFRNVLTGLMYLPFLLTMFRGQLFQKIFAYFMQMVLSSFQLLLVGSIALLLFPPNSDAYFIFRLVGTLILYAVYVTLIYIYGRRFFEKLFIDGRTGAWALYSMGAALSFVLAVVSDGIEQTSIHFLTLFFAVLNFATLCFAIINTNEKASQRYEAELAKSIIATGRDHYQKMDELYSKLRIMRHDYKYHLSAARELLRLGEVSDAEQYLSDVEQKLAQSEPMSFCLNPVINALIVSYAERCDKLKISFEVRFTLQDTPSIPNYEICIVLGNLLENAVEASEKLSFGRKIELAANARNGQLVIMVRNNFDGKLVLSGGQPVSVKKDGGLGRRSVQAVAERYGGKVITEWNVDSFTVYVRLRL